MRYWEELVLLPAPARASGRRRYPASAVGLVELILFLRDLDAWREVAQRELVELAERIAQAQAVRGGSA